MKKVPFPYNFIRNFLFKHWRKIFLYNCLNCWKSISLMQLDLAVGLCLCACVAEGYACVSACVRACVHACVCVCARERGGGGGGGGGEWGGGERNYYVEIKYVTKVFPPRTSLSHRTHFMAFFPLTDLGHLLGQRLQYLTDSFFMPEIFIRAFCHLWKQRTTLPGWSFSSSGVFFDTVL